MKYMKDVGKSVISVCERPNMAKLMGFTGCEKVDKALEFCDLSGGHRLLHLFRHILKSVHLQLLTGKKSSKLDM